ncbi:MAG: isochorismatase family protein [Parachlamydiaceae bacterium]
MMEKNYRLERAKVGLLVIDVQEKLFPYVENSCLVMQAMQKAIRGFQILHIPIYVTEQYPKGLGDTVAILKGVLGEEQRYLTKTAFSCLDEESVKKELLHESISQWVVIGIEAHVCVLQTVKDLLMNGKQVIVLNDAISSRSIYDFSTAIAELRDCGARISSTETVLFELMRNSKMAEFKEISQLIK